MNGQASLLSSLTDDIQFDVVIDGRRLSEIHPTDVGSAVEPPDPSHAQDGGQARHGEVGAVAEGSRLGPQVWPRRLVGPVVVVARLAGVIAGTGVGKKRSISYRLSRFT